jgi:cytoskeletal protein RodZ
MISSQVRNNSNYVQNGWKTFAVNKLSKNSANVVNDDSVFHRKINHSQKARRNARIQKKLALLVLSILFNVALIACSIFMVYRINIRRECTKSENYVASTESIFITIMTTSKSTSTTSTTTTQTSSTTTTTSTSTTTTQTITISARCNQHATFLSNPSAYLGCDITRLCSGACNSCQSGRCSTNSLGLRDCPC